ncbi:hypothetical protein [Ruminococcus sp.]|uniref:hypothetical protein n=1 Tax=Ruminococcus sp. TaxID=41978 RepID=UPI0025D5B8B0|nr:hypothetical protein [Ruminococcus sp.]
MKNRDKYILKVSEYDMLIKIQATMLSHNCCVIDTITGVTPPKDYTCSWFVDYSKTAYERCCKCIQKWLNEEA